jgi:hypothetical protein
MAPKVSCLVVAVAAVALVVGVGPAWSHQIASNNGVAVQTHVDPNDEPFAGQASTIWVVRVKGKGVVFSWKTCRCHLKVFDSSGAVLLDSPATAPKTPVTFPEAAAYGFTFSGRVMYLKKVKSGTRVTSVKKWRPFKVTFAIRAAAPE